MTRLDRLNTLCTRFWLEPAAILAVGDVDGHFSDTAAEDIYPFLAEKETIRRYAAVTRHEDYYYVSPEFDDLGSAQIISAENVNDDIFTEFPICVVDLDTGDEWRPVPKFSWELLSEQAVTTTEETT